MRRIELMRQFNSTDILIRVTGDLLVSCSLEQYVEEMQKAIREFVQTDPEIRILINEMLRTAFQQVDLLKLVTETVKQSVLDANKPVVVEGISDVAH